MPNIPLNSARSEIKKAVKEKTISTEAEAYAIVRKHFPAMEDYKINGIVHPLLPKTPKQIIKQSYHKHPWFTDQVFTVVFEDVWGRVWSRSTGIIRKGIKTYMVSSEWYIDDLGGMMWRSAKADRKVFVCEYRTSHEEVNSACPKPELELK